MKNIEDYWFCKFCDCEVEKEDFKKHRGHRLELKTKNVMAKKRH